MNISRISELYVYEQTVCKMTRSIPYLHMSCDKPNGRSKMLHNNILTSSTLSCNELGKTDMIHPPPPASALALVKEAAVGDSDSI